jgi:hypothetical protein
LNNRRLSRRITGVYTQAGAGIAAFRAPFTIRCDHYVCEVAGRETMMTTRLCAAALGALLLTGCAAHSVRIADLKGRPGEYDEKNISVRGVVTSSWSVPLMPFQLYNLDDGSGEITVLAKSGRAPAKGSHVKVKGRVSEVATLGSQSVGLHIEERDRDYDR